MHAHFKGGRPLRLRDGAGDRIAQWETFVVQLGLGVRRTAAVGGARVCFFPHRNDGRRPRPHARLLSFGACGGSVSHGAERGIPPHGRRCAERAEKLRGAT